MPVYLRLVWLKSLFALWVAARPVTAGEAITIDFVRDIAPLLADRCVACHGPDEQAGRLRLDARKSVFGGGIHGPAVVPRSVEKSLLLARVTSELDEERMPPDDEPLSKQEIDLIRTWIEQGAAWPAEFGAQAESIRDHWAYLKPLRPRLPVVKATDRLRNAIDTFMLAQLETRGLAFSPEASREHLIRRVTLDLIGVPPTRQAIDDFLADESPLAYEKLVDRLLASPAYGERWATPWLDAARYTDSNGYQRDGRRVYWAYRDWVVRALNADMPFDQFTIEQIAGDLLPEPTLDQLIATGFHRGTMANVEAGTDPEEEHVLAVIDRVNTTGTVWLGTTLECGQCHSHKYDPFSQADYYRFYAFFNNTEKEIEAAQEGNRRDFVGPKIPLPISADQRMRYEQLQQQLARLDDKIKQSAEALKAKQPEWERQFVASLDDAETDLPETIRTVVQLPAEKRDKKQQAKLREFYLNQSPEQRDLKNAQRRMRVESARFAPPTTLIMKELPAPRTTRIFKRGDFLKPGEEVQPHTPAVLHEMPADESPNRLTLARWLVAADNPLVARVTVNRHWSEFFGRGLVETIEDFGTQGKRPTHPKLLDWLATEFVRREWSTKTLHRLIVTSAVYRQSSRITPELLAVDPENKLYGRAPRRRLKAEQIRDNALAIAGLLSEKMYGRPVFPVQPDGVWNHIGVASNDWTTSSGEDLYRRGLYIYWRRTVPYPSLVNFDAPSREFCSVERSLSTTPLQALTLLNDPVFFEAATALAGRMMSEPGQSASLEERIAYGFRLATSRQPRGMETEILANRYRSELTRFRESPRRLDALLERWPAPAGVAATEYAGLIGVANVLLNLDEVIVKN